jgi:dTDP-glucose 4,6-dehydratase
LDSDGYEPLELDRRRGFDLNLGCDRIVAALDAFEPQYVVNYAAQGDDAASWTYPADFFQTNCVALSGLVDRLKERTYVRRFLQISSSGVYGTQPGTFAEDAPLAPESPYAISKAAFDWLLLAYHTHFGFPAQIVRPPNIYGPRQQLFRIIPKTAILLRRGETLELHGGGQAVRSFLYVRDVSRAVLAVLERGRAGEVYNISPDETCRIRDVVAVVCELLGKDFETSTKEVEDHRGQQSGLLLESTKIRRQLGWAPQVGLRAGAASVLDWIEREWDELTAEPLAYTHKP